MSSTLPKKEKNLGKSNENHKTMAESWNHKRLPLNSIKGLVMVGHNSSSELCMIGKEKSFTFRCQIVLHNI